MIGVVLSGGRGSRLGGGDKGLLLVGGVPILERVVAALRVQCDDVLINANGDPKRFERLACPVVPDTLSAQPGPLAGVLAGLDHVAARYPSASFVLTVPGDTPFLPRDLVARLQDQRVADRADIVCARSAGSTHYVVALWAVAIRNDLRRAFIDDGIRRVGDVLSRHAVAYVTWPSEPVDPFYNVNSPADLAEAERLVRAERPI